MNVAWIVIIAGVFIVFLIILFVKYPPTCDDNSRSIGSVIQIAGCQ